MNGYLKAAFAANANQEAQNYAVSGDCRSGEPVDPTEHSARDAYSVEHVSVEASHLLGQVALGQGESPIFL